MTVNSGVVAFNIEPTDAVICDWPQAIKLNGITLLNKLIIRNIKKKAVNLKYIKKNDLFKLGSSTKKLTPLYGDYKTMVDLKEYLKSLDPRLKNMKLRTVDNL